MSFAVRLLRHTGLLACVGVSAASASAAPTIRLVPPAGARFLAGQRFDVRVEGQGTGPFSATLMLDGVPLTFTSGAQNTTTTDGISLAGWGGFNLRGFSLTGSGPHLLTATFTDTTGTVSATSLIQSVGVGPQGPVRNVIIMLGDGMGVAHRTAARLVKYGGAPAGERSGFLTMETFPGLGLVTTHSLNSIITDSAPGMAGYASGQHAQNGQEGVYPAAITNPFYFPRVEYLSEYLHRVRGTALGLVSTADLEDATPAANAVHTGNRNAGQGIVDQYFDERGKTGLAVLLGGGRRWFLPQGNFGSSRSSANDYATLPVDVQAGWGVGPGAVDPARDLIAAFQADGFTYADTSTSLTAATSGGAPAKLLGLFGYGNMNVALDKIAKRRNPGTLGVVDDYHAPDQPMLDEMTAAALGVLAQQPNGFVLMVEGAHVDKQSHLMDADRVIGEVLELDYAVRVARNFAATHEGTLVLVLADHETAGFSLLGALTGGVANLNSLPPDNTVVDPATQPQRQTVVGTYDAAGFPHYDFMPDGYPATFDIDRKILVGFGANGDRYEGWLSKPLPVIDGLLPTDIRNELVADGYAAQPYQRAENAFGFFVRGQAVGRDQAVHTAADIPVAAYSRDNSWLSFVGVQRNTDVFFKIARLVLGPPSPARDMSETPEDDVKTTR